MVIETDDRSGFCFGVKNAVETAEKALIAGEKIYSLGQIVHNEIEIERLQALGLETISYDRFLRLSNCKVLIRAHGEPPETYKIAAENNITLIDATCPIVKKIQEKIEAAWEKSVPENGQVVIYGKPGHAEVIGLMGHTGNRAILTDGIINLDQIDYTRRIHLFSQTTMNLSGYHELAEKIRSRMREKGVSDPGELLTVHRTICGQVSHRQPSLEKFARSHDVIVFVSGKESSNGKMLFEAVKKVNPDSYFITSPGEVKRQWFEGKKSAGISGATSTPGWLIEQVRKEIEAFNF